MKKFQITFKGQVYELDVEEIGGSDTVANKTVSATTTPSTSPVTQAPKATPKVAPTGTPANAQTILAPMPGKILAVTVKKGDSVKRGDVLCILEAMKMENEIMANQAGTISDVRAIVGQIVSTGDVLIVMG